mmetsp:Transcript_49317/g.147303  ORF Transcript_49317/g.147303 Transcript_49317/m.147303 type:complete len:261 (+) Transcript_49317:223-1005(+)
MYFWAPRSNKAHQGVTLKSLKSTPAGGQRFAWMAFMPPTMGSRTRAAPSASVSGAASTTWLPPGFIQETQPGSTAEAKMDCWRRSPAIVFANMFRPAFATFVCAWVPFLLPLGVVNEPSWDVTNTTNADGALHNRGNHLAVSRYGTTRFTVRTSTNSGISVSSKCCVQLVTVRKSSCSPCTSVRPGGNHADFMASASTSLLDTGSPTGRSTGNSASASFTRLMSAEAAGASGSTSPSSKWPSSSSRRMRVSYQAGGRRTV